MGGRWWDRLGEQHGHICITICKIDGQWEFAVCLRELKQGLYINLERWDGDADGREARERRDMAVPMADSC